MSFCRLTIKINHLLTLWACFSVWFDWEGNTIKISPLKIFEIFATVSILSSDFFLSMHLHNAEKISSISNNSNHVRLWIPLTRRSFEFCFDSIKIHALWIARHCYVPYLVQVFFSFFTHNCVCSFYFFVSQCAVIWLCALANLYTHSNIKGLKVPCIPHAKSPKFEHRHCMCEVL